jgi:hypothetical protein
MVRDYSDAVGLRRGRTHLVYASLLPRRVRLSINATQPSRWIRIGLLPGIGSFNGSKTVFSFCSILLVRAGESRTLYLRG